MEDPVSQRRKLPAFVERGGLLEFPWGHGFFSTPKMVGLKPPFDSRSQVATFGWISRVWWRTAFDFLFSWDFVRICGGANISWTELKLGLTSSWCVELIPWLCWIYRHPVTVAASQVIHDCTSRLHMSPSVQWHVECPYFFATLQIATFGSGELLLRIAANCPRI